MIFVMGIRGMMKSHPFAKTAKGWGTHGMVKIENRWRMGQPPNLRKTNASKDSLYSFVIFERSPKEVPCGRVISAQEKDGRAQQPCLGN
jgi:hypothetical protein